ncbi:MAG: phage tail protein [Comamonadaceae bacterium]|nr:MAG: phage tail protein [Comamonadaceae bacterium]
MAQVPTGSTFHVATAFGAVKPITGISNAAEAVVSCATHDYIAGDIVEITSGWGRLNLRVFRVKSVVAGVSFVLEGADTSNANFFGAGGGVGSVRKIATFTQILTVMNPASSGGDPKTVNYKFIESDVEFSINDGFSATGYTVDLDADSIGQAGYNALKNLTDVQTNTVLKIVTRSGSLQFIPCTVALNEAVQMADGQINKVKASFNGNNRITRYAA